MCVNRTVGIKYDCKDFKRFTLLYVKLDYTPKCFLSRWMVVLQVVKEPLPTWHILRIH